MAINGNFDIVVMLPLFMMVLLISTFGYDEYNTYLYDPQKGETYPYGMNDSTELFEKAGNIFISYVEKLKL